MTTFTVWKYDDPQGAEHAVSLLQEAASEGLVKIDDHAVVSWPVGAAHPTTKHGHEDNWRGAGWGALWGLLFGALFAIPLVGVAVGAGAGALSKARERLGISDQQLERIRQEVTEGTSALFLVTEQGDLDRLGERMRGTHSRLIETNLTDAERRELIQTFDS
jgi:uncharacterized membrane protein